MDKFVVFYMVRRYAPGKFALRMFWDHDAAVEYAARQPAPGAFVAEHVRRRDEQYA
jgi:hypothetical protein